MKALRLCLAKVEFSTRRLAPVAVLIATSIFSLPIFLISKISRIPALTIILLISVGCITLFSIIRIDILHTGQYHVCHSVILLLVFWLDWFVLSSTLELACMCDVVLKLLTFAHFLAGDSCTLWIEPSSVEFRIGHLTSLVLLCSSISIGVGSVFLKVAWAIALARLPKFLCPCQHFLTQPLY